MHSALARAEIFIEFAVSQKLEFGCLFYSKTKDSFIEPNSANIDKDLIPHAAKIGGVLPRGPSTTYRAYKAYKAYKFEI